MVDLYGVANVEGLPAKDNKMLEDLVVVWEKKRSKNLKRIEYYLGHNDLKNLGISIPPEMLNKLSENTG